VCVMMLILKFESQQNLTSFIRVNKNVVLVVHFSKNLGNKR